MSDIRNNSEINIQEEERLCSHLFFDLFELCIIYAYFFINEINKKYEKTDKY
jgi:hypothetical protein